MKLLYNHRESSMTAVGSRHSWIAKWHVGLLLLISLPALLWRLDTYPPIWYDEGFRTHQARTLVERGVYGTYTTDGYRPFDPSTTAGPADIISLAISYKFLGPGVAQARLAILPFALLGVIVLYAVSVMMYGSTTGLLATLLVLAVPPIRGVSFLLFGRQVMSETTSLAMIILGLWLCFRSWETQGWSRASLLAGLALGLGLLSKMQVGFALLPTLALIATARWLSKRSRFLVEFAPLLVMMGVLIGWKLIEWFETPGQLRQENSEMLFEAVRTLLVPDLFGRTLTRSSLLIVAVMSLGVLASSGRLLSSPPETRLTNTAWWAEATLVLLVLCSALWFVFLSVGQPRYAHLGFVVSLLLVGRAMWVLFQHILRKFRTRWLECVNHMPGLALAGLGLVALFVNTYPLAQTMRHNDAQKAADFVRNQIPRDAVIESWEWELDALSSHWEYHHPDWHYQLLATRQLLHERKPFDLKYDVLQADPDYLIEGAFSDWTRIYDQQVVEENFAKLAEFGPYRIYKRIR